MNNIYTFKWNKGDIVFLTVLCLLEVLCIYAAICVAMLSQSLFFFAAILPIPAVWGFYIYALLRSHLRHVELRPGGIIVARFVGKPLYWENVLDIKPVDKAWMKIYAGKRNTNYKDLDTVFSMRNAYYTAPSIGEFERISNNLDELALVTLANGKKYIINYPHDQITEEAIAHVTGKKNRG